MIRLKHTVLLASMAFAGACTTTKAPEAQVAAPPVTTMENHGCPDARPGSVPINIHYPPGANGNPGKIAVTPHHAGQNAPLVHVGSVLRFNIIDGPDETLVSTSGKTPDAGWLNGSGKKKEGKSKSRMFYICVPHDLVPYGTDEIFEYNVDAYNTNPLEEWPQLDPRVTVRNP